MADNTTLNAGTGGDVVATDDLATLNGGASGTVKVQRVKIGYGADGDFNDVSAATPLPIVGRQSAATALSVTSATSATGTIACTGYNVATVTITGTYAGINLTFEVSTDGGTTWVPCTGAQLDASVLAQGATGVITANASRGWDIAVGAADSIRVRATAYTSGTGNVRIALQTLPYEPSPVVSLAASALTIGAVTGSGTFTVDTELPAAAASADGLANPTTPQVGADQLVFNGTTWDRFRGHNNTIPDTSSAKTATGNGATQTNYNAAGLFLAFLVTAVSGTTPTLVGKIQWSPDGGTTWVDLDATNAATVSITATGTYVLKVYPGIATAANASLNSPLPRTWRAVWTIGGTTPSFTFSTNAAYIL